ncbi:MAG: carboxypeptidase-like regulatory domain-containing protein [Chitinispirillaceae bacterium]
MLRKTGLGVVILMLCCVQLYAQPTTDYLVVEAPIGAKPADQLMWVKWSGTSRDILDPTFLAPDSGRIYFDRSPGGGDLSNYRYQITAPATDSVTGTKLDNIYFRESPLKRGTAFRPSEQENMGTGVFYCIVAWPMPDDTLYSNEFQIMVESPDPVNWEAPSGEISNLTPTFSWEANPGVPYYHVILSDEPISADTSSGTINVSGLSVVWQAITPNTQITYGTPDPSNTITADPPPLSPGKRYTWIVLNNYGNHMAFSSPKVSLPVGEFRVAGDSLTKPKSVYPLQQNLDNINHPAFDFRWTNLDTSANAYQVNLYIRAEIQGIGGYMLVWETTVANSAQTPHDTLSAGIDAAGTLTENRYLWKVIALDDRGAGTAGDTSSFSYSSPSGTMNVYTREKVPIVRDGEKDTVVSPVGLAEIQVEVIEGPMEAPLAFYTDLNGNLSRTRPAGTYRVTAVKEDYELGSRTVTVKDDSTSYDTLYLVRPEATMYGKVTDPGGRAVNLAKIVAVSERGDSVTGYSDALGNFTLNCYSADWSYHVKKSGYRSSLPSTVTIGPGQNYNCPTTVMEVNPYSLSGTVRNSDGVPILGVQVQILQDGEVIDETSSTSQDGTFTFTTPPGTYVITAEKAGFSAYSSEVTMTGSKSVNITLSPGAALVNGSVVGGTWVEGELVTASIPSARIKFVDVSSPADSFIAKSDAVFGKFSKSLPGDRTFLVYTSAQGFVSSDVPDTLQTVSRSTHLYRDTLRSRAMVGGVVAMKGADALGRVDVMVYDTVSNRIVATGRSSADGQYEIRDIPDGSYVMIAGKESLALDSIWPGSRLDVTAGKPEPSFFQLYLLPGTRTVKWQIDGYSGSGSVKIQSPVVKTISFTDSLTGAGSGTYIIEADAEADSLVDLSYRRFTVQDTELVHTEDISFDVVHLSPDTLSPSSGKVQLTLRSSSELDSAALHYRSEGNRNFRTVVLERKGQEYEFSFSPDREGCNLFYYFKAFSGSDVYGYEKELFRTYVKPDTARRLTKHEISPSSSSAPLVLPASYTASFSFRGFHSSSFIPHEKLNPDGISWSLHNSNGCELLSDKGLSVRIKTTSKKVTSQPVLLIATIDTSRISIDSSVSRRDTVELFVSGSALDQIIVYRTDLMAPNPITTSGNDVAKFRAEGIDADGNVVDISPEWSIEPKKAGVIDQNGQFRPSPSFVGYVRVFASNGFVRGEFSPLEGGTEVTEAGLCVRYMLRSSSSPDTAQNHRGIKIVFPARAVDLGDVGLLDVSVNGFRNQLMKGIDGVRMCDSVAFDIEQLENIPLRVADDSIRLVLDIPGKYRKQAMNGTKKFWVARWNEDSLMWVPLENSRVSTDGYTVSAGVTGFSRYTVVTKPGELSGSLKVSPNPFSPYIRPVREYGSNAPYGTCIKFSVEAPEPRVPSVKLHIFNATGHRVWAVELLNVSVGEHSVWWNGKTTGKEEVWNPDFTDGGISQGLMCRNGRYFVVVMIRDVNGKEVKFMKHLVLMK